MDKLIKHNGKTSAICLKCPECKRGELVFILDPDIPGSQKMVTVKRLEDIYHYRIRRYCKKIKLDDRMQPKCVVCEECTHHWYLIQKRNNHFYVWENGTSKLYKLKT